MNRLRDEAIVFKRTTIDQARDMVDESWTLDSILEDRRGVRGHWVEITGTTILDPDWEGESGLSLGRIDESADVYQVVHVDWDEEQAPGTRVRVLGYVFASVDPYVDEVEQIVAEGFEAWALVLMHAKEVTVLD